MAHDQLSSKMYGTVSSLSKSSALPTTTGGGADTGLGGGATGAGSSSSFKHSYDSKSSSGSGGYNYGVPSNQGYIGTYMGVSHGCNDHLETKCVDSRPLPIHCTCTVL